MTFADLFPAATPGAPRAHDISRTARFHHSLLLELDDPQITARAEQMAEAASLVEEGETRWIHGDYHVGQLMISREGTVGLVDVDRSGIGHPVDDLATFLAHLFHASNRRPMAHAMSLSEDVLAVANERFGRQLVRSRITAVLLGLSTMAYARQEPGWKHQVLTDMDAALEWSQSLA